jgi:hypothetical protein
MFLYRVKIEELDGSRAIRLKSGLSQEEETLFAHFPIQQMSIVGEEDELDIYLALDDVIGPEQLRRLAGDIKSMVKAHDHQARVSAEIIHV